MKRFSLVLAGLLLPAVLQAQLPDPSTRALGVGDAYTSLARGYEAVYWNPAMLAALDQPGFTIGLPHVDVEVGSNVYGFSDFRKYANSFLSDADKQALLNKMGNDSSLTIRALGGLAPFGQGPDLDLTHSLIFSSFLGATRNERRAREPRCR